MKLRFPILSCLLSTGILCVLSLQQALGQAGGEPGKTAKILVLVRDGRGAPVAGLAADDFVVMENGVRDSVMNVERFSSDDSRVSPGIPKELEQAGTSPSQSGVSWRAMTHVLLIIAPMSAEGRHRAISDALRFLSRPEAATWRIALVDDAGSYVPYGQSPDQLKSALQKLASRFSTPLSGDSFWLMAHRAIEQLGVLPGRHAVIVASDYGPTEFIDSALRAQAPIYAVQSSGPTVAVPFGSAASEGQYHGSGQFFADQVMDNIVQLGNLRGDFLHGADETGGSAVSDLKDAFDHIGADAAGYYVVSFQAHPNEANGTWNPVSVSVRMPHLQVKGPHYYVAPFERNAGPIPADMKKALRSSERLAGLEVAAHAWLFPASDVHTGAFAAELTWADGEGAPRAGSRLRIFAELTNDSTQGIAGSWYEERDWPSDGGLPLSIHWQREASLFPGAYTLRVIGMDATSGKIGTGTFAFLARPLSGPALRFSAVVLSDECLSASEQAKMRRNLFDPMTWEGCKLAPSPAAHFKLSQNPTVLVRLYPPDEEFSKLIIKQWKACAVMDEDTGRGKSVPLSITPAEIRGLAAWGKVRLSEMHLSPGPHQLTVVFEFHGDDSRKQRIPFTTEFWIEQ